MGSRLESLGYAGPEVGSFSAVYTSPDGRFAVKVQDQPDPAWVDFARACMGPLRGDPAFPEVYQLETFGDGLGVAVMERLDKLGSLPHGLEQFSESVMGYEADGDAAGDFERAWPELSLSIRRVREVVGGELDLHRGNVMLRPGTGEIVLADPVRT